MNRDKNRLEKVKNDRIELLKRVKSSLSNNKDSLNNTIDSINKVIEMDDSCVKKLDAISKSQELIASLIEELMSAESIKDVEKLRNKVNYLINKIKKEIKSRNISEDSIEEYKEKVSYLRKDISKYIRYLKRNNNILKIENMLKNHANLSEEELKELKKLLKGEIRYNTRNLKEETKKKEESLEEFLFPKRKVTPEIGLESVESLKEFLFPNSGNTEEKKKLIDDSLSDILPKCEIPEKKDFNFDFLFKDTDEKAAKKATEKPVDDTVMEEYYDKMNEYLKERADIFSVRYKIRDTYEYSSSAFANFVNLFRNIPIYIMNRAKIKDMISDTRVFYRGGDLLGYIEYTKKRNSILTGLKCLFSKSYLFRREGQYLNIHNNCSEWLIDFCEQNDLKIPLTFKKAN